MISPPAPHALSGFQHKVLYNNWTSLAGLQVFSSPLGLPLFIKKDSLEMGHWALRTSLK